MIISFNASNTDFSEEQFALFEKIERKYFFTVLHLVDASFSLDQISMVARLISENVDYKQFASVYYTPLVMCKIGLLSSTKEHDFVVSDSSLLYKYSYEQLAEIVRSYVYGIPASILMNSAYQPEQMRLIGNAYLVGVDYAPYAEEWIDVQEAMKDFTAKLESVSKEAGMEPWRFLFLRMVICGNFKQKCSKIEEYIRTLSHCHCFSLIKMLSEDLKIAEDPTKLSENEIMAECMENLKSKMLLRWLLGYSRGCHSW